MMKKPSIKKPQANVSSNSEVQPGTKATFIEATQAPVHVPLSGRTLSLNENGTCVDGCTE
ncbi:hypothetical protein [Leptolyngbya sp. BC1307]|uniref:hypothetical protein n=1 Tax=Leptolyngbya sp. BC1307 TaxID=2029589 RepID=UPI001140CADB|nr:hypothetical protein [Leptolyngbya sp. BC1307]